MRLPAQVKADIRRVEELEAQLRGAPAGDKPEDATEPEGASTDTEVEAGPPAGESTPPTPAEEKPSKPSEDFEQKYRSLRGKYDAEVPRLHQQVKALTAQIEELQKAQAKPEPEQPPEPKRYVTDADKEAFGEDLLDVQRRVAMEVAEKYEAQLSAMKRHIDNLESKLTETGGQIGAMTFEQRLRSAVPDFDTVNRDPRWVEWLDEHDPIVRGPRRVMAQRAFDAGDAEAVADYVKLFKASVQEQSQQSDRKAELERQVAPKRTAAATPPPSQKPAAKVYTEAKATEVWGRIRDLSMRGQHDEAAKLEAEISAAYVEGRVVPG